MLLRIFAALNNSIKYSSIFLISTQILYNFHTREALNLLRFKDIEIYDHVTRSRDAP